MNQETLKLLKRDICEIVHYLTAPEVRSESEEEWERFDQVMINRTFFKEKYGNEVINIIAKLILDIPNKVALVAKIRGGNNV